MAARIDNQAGSVPTVLLVPGLWHGGWAWQKIEELLEARNIPHVSVTFPGRDRKAGDETFAGHCRYLRARIEALEGPVVVVAHSYGGAVVTEAVPPWLVDALVFVAAFPLKPGESISDVIDGQYGSEVEADTIRQNEGYLEVDHETAISGFYQDCDPAEAEAAFSLLTPEHASTRSSKVTMASWLSIPSHYVICTDDRAMPTALQRELAKRVGTASEIASGHSPMISHPNELSDVIERVVRGLGAHL